MGSRFGPFCVLLLKKKLHVLGGASWGRSSQGERPRCYSWLDIVPDDVSSRKCWKGVRRPAVKTRKSVAHKRKENHDLIN